MVWRVRFVWVNYCYYFFGRCSLVIFISEVHLVGDDGCDFNRMGCYYKLLLRSVFAFVLPHRRRCERNVEH